ncbi:hypothetical protein JTB14_029718 [Gonioctena quinquepunctata]|nr:hypothetical protein JTB14_029718 [Gonioctena quinquepunctata]
MEPTVFLWIISISFNTCSVLPHVASVPVTSVPVAPALRYTLVTPQNVRPFAGQINTFTEGLNVYAAGIGGPAIVDRSAQYPIDASAPHTIVASAPYPVFAPSPVLP